MIRSKRHPGPSTSELDDLPPCPDSDPDDILDLADLGVSPRTSIRTVDGGNECREIPTCPNVDKDDSAFDIFDLGASIRTIQGVQCRELPPCPPIASHDTADNGGSILINPRTVSGK